MFVRTQKPLFSRFPPVSTSHDRKPAHEDRVNLITGTHSLCEFIAVTTSVFTLCILLVIVLGFVVIALKKQISQARKERRRRQYVAWRSRWEAEIFGKGILKKALGLRRNLSLDSRVCLRNKPLKKVRFSPDVIIHRHYQDNLEFRFLKYWRTSPEWWRRWGDEENGLEVRALRGDNGRKVYVYERRWRRTN